MLSNEALEGLLSTITEYHTPPSPYLNFYMSPTMHKHIYILIKLAAQFPAHRHKKLRKCVSSRITTRRQEAKKRIERMYQSHKFPDFLHPRGFLCVRNGPIEQDFYEDATQPFSGGPHAPIPLNQLAQGVAA